MYFSFIRFLIHFFCIILVSLTFLSRCLWPYEWWGWREPSVKTATAETPHLKPLQGLKMSPYTAQIFTEITNIIRSNTQPSDTIYVFPHMPIFYLLSERFPPTWAIVDYFDVCSDQCAKIDAEMLNKNPPTVFVIHNFPKHVWIAHEKYFRQGKPSGQREIMRVVNSLIKKCSYTNVTNYRSTIPDYTIQVWVRSSTIKEKSENLC